jgi:hypothetical protein
MTGGQCPDLQARRSTKEHEGARGNTDITCLLISTRGVPRRFHIEVFSHFRVVLHRALGRALAAGGAPGLPRRPPTGEQTAHLTPPQPSPRRRTTGRIHPYPTIRLPYILTVGQLSNLTLRKRQPAPSPVPASGPLSSVVGFPLEWSRVVRYWSGWRDRHVARNLVFRLQWSGWSVSLRERGPPSEVRLDKWGVPVFCALRVSARDHALRGAEALPVGVVGDEGGAMVASHEP